MTESLDEAYLRQWIGRQESVSDVLSPTQAALMNATLDYDAPDPRPGDPLPPLWHWIYFVPRHRASEIAEDGHAQRGGFLPPVPLPRRMWAGGRLIFHAPLRLGAEAERISTVQDVKVKQGRSGTLAFATVRHELRCADGGHVVEEQDIVYREPPSANTPTVQPQTAPQNAQWSRQVVPDPVALFRYSALTFNGHRIHFDRPFCQDHEGYPGLVVHGPLIATLLMELARQSMPGESVTGYQFRAVSPLFDTESFSVHGRQEGKSISLWASSAAGALAMDATARLA
jgi:3-methylfumaryl-CoA hydratase